MKPSPFWFSLTPDLTIRDVLHKLSQQYRFPLWSGYCPYVLRLSAADTTRLKRTGADLSLDAKVQSLGVEQLELVKRTCAPVPPLPYPYLVVVDDAVVSPGRLWMRAGNFADVPAEPSGIPSAVSSRATGRFAAIDPADLDDDDLPEMEKRGAQEDAGKDADTATGGSGVPQPGGSGFVYTIVSAARYEEWEVVKVNKRGRRQLRIMGIDLTHVRNKKVEKKRFGSNDTFRVRRLAMMT